MRKTLILIVIALIFIVYHFGWYQYLDLQYLKANLDHFKVLVLEEPSLFISAYFLIYVLTAALSIPGATVLTLAGGAIFGFTKALILISFASSLGATLAFLTARYLFKDTLQSRYAKRLQVFNQGVRKDGAFYLFSLRLIPIVPFFLINVVMGLTPMRTWTFYWISQVGMLAGTAVYVNAGTQLAQIHSLQGILSADVIGSFVLIGIFPFIARIFVSFLKKLQVYKNFCKPKSFDYNVIAIGAGAAGLVTSYIAATVKAKVALVEKHKMGGDCLNTGCIPSKALIKSAKVASLQNRAQEFGLQSIDVQIDFAQVMERVQNIIQKIEPHDSVERYTALGVDCIQGEAKIISPWEVQVNNQVFTTKNIVIATGARPAIPKIPGLDQVQYLTSETLWQLRAKPKHLLVLGGGPIGCELSQAMARLGVKVTLVEQKSQLMSREDPEFSNAVAKYIKADGVDLKLNCEVKSFAVVNNESFAIIEQNQEAMEVPFDMVLLALGRKANTEGFGLEELKLKLSQDGTLAVDEKLRTRFPNIYACGDVAGPYQFTHTAAHQAWYATVNALFAPFKTFNVDYRIIPWATYTDPEVARVGLNETQAKEQNISYKINTYEFKELDRAITESEDKGFIKILTQPGSDQILGVTVMGNHAGDVIAEFVLAMKHNLGLNKILNTIHIYPTLAEANKQVAGEWKKSTKPERLISIAEAFHRWRRQ